MNVDALARPLPGFALFLFSLALFVAPAAMAAALVLLWIALFTRRAAPGWWRDPAVVLVLAFALLAPLRALLGQMLFAEPPALAWGGVWEWLQLAAVLPFALALRGDAGLLRRLLALVLIGLLLGMPLRANWELLLADPRLWFAWREGFGFTAIAFGLYSGAALLGVILLRWPEASAGALGKRLWLRWAVALLLAQGLLLTQSRGAWLGFVLALALGLWLRRRADRGAAARVRLPRRAQVALVGVLVVVVGLNALLIAHRLTQEAGSAVALLEWQVDPHDRTSIGYRWRVQQLGLRLWSERPWLGWGAGTTTGLIAAEAEALALIDQGHVLKHLHNSYLEILAQFGIVGLLLFAALVAALFQGLLAAWRARILPVDLAIALVCVLVLTLVWNLFDFRMMRQDWRGFWTLVAGSALSFALAARGRFRDAGATGQCR